MKTFKDLRQEINCISEDNKKSEWTDIKTEWDRLRHPYALRNLKHTIIGMAKEIPNMIKNPTIDTPLQKRVRDIATDEFAKKLQQKSLKKKKV